MGPSCRKAIVGAACATALAVPATASGATINVTTAADVVASDGACSLREAITAANSDSAVGGCAAGLGQDLVKLPAGTFRIQLPGAAHDANASGDLDIAANTTVEGAGPGVTTIDGAGLDRVFDVRPSGTAAEETVQPVTRLVRLPAAASYDLGASLGVPVSRVYAGTFAFGIALAGLAGVLLAPVFSVFPTMGRDFIFMAFTVVIVGGMGSIIGTVIAGLVLTQVQVLSSLIVSPVWSDPIVFSIMVLVLVLRPQGLFGRIGHA